MVKSELLENFTKYILTTYLSIAMLALIRFGEFLIVKHYGIHNVTINTLFNNSINLDAYFAIALSIFLIIPFFLISFLSPKFGKIFYFFVWIITILSTISLTHFFISGEYLLTNVLFQFSFEEIWHIIAIESGTHRNMIWLLYLILPIFIVAYLYMHKNIKLKKWVNYLILASYITLVIITAVNFKYYYKPSYKFTSQFEFFISNNKIAHFIKSAIKSQQSHKELNSKDLLVAIHNFHTENKGFDYESLTFPLLHNEEYANVLGQYFNTSNKAPNIVFIVSEGLASSFAGLHPTTQHLLPFIDSLAANGLYWQNFLSNCCRTYGVLPNVLGSLTSGTLERGFVNFNGEKLFEKRYPDHNSLIKELRNNNYFTSFFYGGWGAFDSYQFFLEEQNIDLFMDMSKFDSVKYIAPWKRIPKGFYWGYDDKALFNQGFDYMNTHKINQPYLNIYLTLNMHEPYNICPIDYYANDFILSRLKKLKLENSPFKGKDNFTLGSLFFYEDALKEFFKNYKKRDDYNNTIFIIFGDHYSVMAFLNNPLEIYHVPLIIYSPLIKKPEKFKGVSTHLDILPSLVALLQYNYGLTFNNEKQWLGQGLDTSKIFHCDRIAPLNLYSPDLPHFIFHDYFTTQDAVYKITDDLNATVVADTLIINKVNRFALGFKAIDNYVCNQNKIWRK